MAGIFLNNIDVYNSFCKWVEGAVILKGEKHPLTCHVSKFLGTGLSNDELIEESVNILLESVSIAVEKEFIYELMPLLVIPLGCSENMALWDSSNSLVDQLGVESPSIYFFEREKAKYLERLEEYRVPVDLNIPEIRGSNYSIYYRCFRDNTAIENDWEFSMALYIECYPDNLVN